MANDRMILEDLLIRRGYKRNESAKHPNELGDKEFMKNSTARGILLQLGKGRTGEDDCFSNFYFNEHGDFLEHSAEVED